MPSLLLLPLLALSFFCIFAFCTSRYTIFFSANEGGGSGKGAAWAVLACLPLLPFVVIIKFTGSASLDTIARLPSLHLSRRTYVAAAAAAADDGNPSTLSRGSIPHPHLGSHLTAQSVVYAASLCLVSCSCLPSLTSALASSLAYSSCLSSSFLSLHLLPRPVVSSCFSCLLLSLLLLLSIHTATLCHTLLIFAAAAVCLALLFYSRTDRQTERGEGTDAVRQGAIGGNLGSFALCLPRACLDVAACKY